MKNTLTRKEYVEQRKALIAEAEAYAGEGSREKFETARAQIEALDTNYDEARTARANARAMRDQLESLRDSGVTQDADMAAATQVVDRIGDGVPSAYRNNLAPSAERGRTLKAKNAATLTSSGILLPTHQSDEIQPAFNVVSGLIDRVRHFPRRGGESFETSYVKGYGEGAETGDSADYHDAATKFGAAALHKSKITAYDETDEGVLKLPDADYDAEVVQGVRIALRRRITRQILIGSGATNVLTGIFNSTYSSSDETKGAIDPATDLPLADIADGTLDAFIFGYGGEEDVEDGAVLLLNKLDLAAFARLRDGNGNRVHTIRLNGNSGTIDGVDFIVNSACKPLSAAGTAVDDFVMAYGHLSSYGLAVFSDVDVQHSTEFKFRSGQVAHRASVYVGGNVIRWNGFLRAKKADEA